MNSLLRDRWAAGVLSAALVVSFALCVSSDLRFSATLTEAGIVLPTSAGTITLGLSWLLGHGLHGAAALAVPVLFLARNRVVAVDEANKAS